MAGASEAAPEAVRQAVGGGCQSGWGQVMSGTNAIEAGVRGTVAGHRVGALPPPPRAQSMICVHQHCTLFRHPDAMLKGRIPSEVEDMPAQPRACGLPVLTLTPNALKQRCDLQSPFPSPPPTAPDAIYPLPPPPPPPIRVQGGAKDWGGQRLGVHDAPDALWQ